MDEFLPDEDIVATAAPRAFDVRAFRRALGCFATGVTVITAAGSKAELIGITASSFNSVSLDPPLVLFSLGRATFSLRAFLSTHHFAVNVLSTGQQDLARRFATPSSDKWAGVRYDLLPSGCPILHDALACFECQTRYTYDGGDHVIFVGEVLSLTEHQGEPLIFYRGRYARVAEA